MAAELRGAPWGLDCRACPRQHRCDEWPDPELIAAWGGSPRPPEGMGEEWGGRCPAAWLNHPEIAIASRLLDQARVSPLSDWPGGYAAWVVEAVTEFKAAEDALKRG